MKRIEYTPQDFAWTQWDVEEIQRIANDILQQKTDTYTHVKNILAEERTFENTVLALEASNHVLTYMLRLGLLMNVSPSKEIREACKQAIERVEKELVDIEYDEGIYRALKEYEARHVPRKGEDEKLFRDMMRDYRRMGFELASKDREILKANLKKISELSNEFGKNINEYKDVLAVTREDLEGLSEGYIANLKRDERGYYLISLDYPELHPFMEHAVSGAKRKELAAKALRKGGERNVVILKELVRLRNENARLLGYESHAHFQLEPRMAKHPDHVFRFVNEVAGALRNKVQEEMEELSRLKKELFPDQSGTVEYHDIAFLSNESKKRKFSVDTQKIQEYFPLEKVKQGMFAVYSKLFSVRFERLLDYPLWHEDVELYKVMNTDGEAIAYFALDLYPREGKYGHAAEFDVIRGHREGERYISPMASMVANFSKPGPGHPSLLTHYEAITFFHEFGHVMHDMLTTANHFSQSGTSTARDFVELPSQMLENWMWDKEILAMISSHSLTGEPLPENMVDGMLLAKKHGVGYAKMRQLAMTAFDMILHTEGVDGDMNEAFARLFEEYTGLTLPEGQIFLAGWGHLTGYDAGYYGYLWSEVYAADVFSRFRKEGLLNAEIGMEYRKHILERGSSEEEVELLRSFLGRDPENQAFLKEIGVLK